MIIKFIEGKDGISHHEFNWKPGRSQNVDDDHDKFCREAPGRSNRTSTTSSKRTDAAKDYLNHG